MKLLSPAKINLYLHVLRKRADGYHDIDTLFERVSLFDEIELRAAPSGIQVECPAKGVPSGRKNLAYRTAALLKERFGASQGVVIKIKKNIPIAAGLGGGSSNAATVLLGLNRLWKLHLSRRKLLALAAEIGSDVPFFILEKTFAIGKGRGEILSAIRSSGPPLWHCLVKPPFGISTKEAYQRCPSSFLTPPRGDARMTIRSLQKGNSEHLAGRLVNSLERALNKRVISKIAIIKNALKKEGALACLLSGSGSTVFGVFSSKQSALKAARHLKKNGWKTFAVSSY